jgi:hypothetical protein
VLLFIYLKLSEEIVIIKPIRHSRSHYPSSKQSHSLFIHIKKKKNKYKNKMKNKIKNKINNKNNNKNKQSNQYISPLSKVSSVPSEQQEDFSEQSEAPNSSYHLQKTLNQKKKKKQKKTKKKRSFPSIKIIITNLPHSPRFLPVPNQLLFHPQKL